MQIPDDRAGTDASEASAARTLIIACGALAHEIRFVIERNGLDHLELACLPATLHNRPELIAQAVQARIREARPRYERIYCAYAECGTGGALDAVLAQEGVPRIAGPHCYAFFAGHEAFDRLAEEEIGTFYLTDFLARQFDTLFVKGLGLDRHPELAIAYFGNYRRLAYLSQSDDPALLDKARAAAGKLGLDFLHVRTGFGELELFVQSAADGGGEPPVADPDEAAPVAVAADRAARGWRRGPRARAKDRRRERD